MEAIILSATALWWCRRTPPYLLVSGSSRRGSSRVSFQLAAVCHAGELPRSFPFFLFVPGNHGLMFTVGVVHHCHLFLRGARHEGYRRAQQLSACDAFSNFTNQYQHKSQYLQVALGHLAPSCW